MIAIGLVGCLVPIIPGCALVAFGVLIYKLWIPQGTVSWNFVFVCLGLTLLAQGLDLLCSYWGARKFGATWRGGVGALLGAIIGLFIPPPLLWLVLGPVIGAIGLELLGGRNLKDSGKAGFGTLVGGIVAFVMKFAIACSMAAWFWLGLFSKA